MLRRNINSFDLVKKDHSYVYFLSYQISNNEMIASSIPREDILPVIDSFMFKIEVRNGVGIVELTLTFMDNIVNESKILDDWTYDHDSSGSYRYIILFKHPKQLKPFALSTFEPLDILTQTSKTPDSRTFLISKEGYVMLRASKSDTNVSCDDYLLNKRLICMLWLHNNSKLIEKKKHHKSIYKYSKHVLLLHNKRRILYA